MAQNQLTRKAFCLEPLDVLSFRDGRPFGGGSYAKSGLPYPQTLAGALRTALLKAYGCDFNRLAEAIRSGKSPADAFEAAGAPAWIARMAFRGPWLASTTKGGVEPYVVLPANVQRNKRERDVFHVLKPLNKAIPAPGWKPPEGEALMRPMWHSSAERTERMSGFLSFSGLGRYLSGQTMTSKDVVAAGPDGPLYAIAERTGIGLDPDRLSVEEGLIYGSGFLALRPGVLFYGEALFDQSAPADALDSVDLVSFGGEGRKAVLKPVAPVKWPNPAIRPGQKSFYLLTTPAFFAGRWVPAALRGKIVGAAVGDGLPVSGWDLARGGPKPTRFAAPAGSVYFVDQQVTETIENLSEGEEDLLAGYGCCLKGVWTDELEKQK